VILWTSSNSLSIHLSAALQELLFALERDCLAQGIKYLAEHELLSVAELDSSRVNRKLDEELGVPQQEARHSSQSWRHIKRAARRPSMEFFANAFRATSSSSCRKFALSRCGQRLLGP